MLPTTLTQLNFLRVVFDSYRDFRILFIIQHHPIIHLQKRVTVLHLQGPTFKLLVHISTDHSTDPNTVSISKKHGLCIDGPP
jgi:hypothetical protein